MVRVTRIGRTIALLGILTLLLTLIDGPTAHAETDKDVRIASSIFESLNGVKWTNVSLLQRQEMINLVANKDYVGAARKATESATFIDVTVRRFASYIMGGDPTRPLDDTVATIVGVVRDNRDFRDILTANITYSAPGVVGLAAVSPSNNNHYAQIETRDLSLNQVLVSGVQNFAEPSGVLTLRGFGETYEAGTNRAAMENIFNYFFKKPIIAISDTTISDQFVRMDVERLPGGDSSDYENKCKGCHSPMDRMAGAFAKVVYDGSRLLHASTSPNAVDGDGNRFFADGIAVKYNRAADTYPAGYRTTDNSWGNLIKSKEAFGWNSKDASQGAGINSLATVIANAKAFADGISEWAYLTVCKNEIDKEKHPALAQQLGTVLVDNGYDIHELMANIVAHPTCTDINS